MSEEKLDETRVTPWYMAVGFAELMLFAAKNDAQQPRNPDANDIYYERCTITKISGMSSLQEGAGVLPADSKTGLVPDARTFLDCIQNPYERDILRSIINANYSLDMVRQRLNDNFNERGQDNVSLIFKNWERFQEFETLIMSGDPSAPTRQDRDNADIISRSPAELQAIVRSYTFKFILALKNALDYAKTKELLWLGSFLNLRTDDLASGGFGLNLKEIEYLGTLKDINVHSEIERVVTALIWIFMKNGTVNTAKDGLNIHFTTLNAIGYLPLSAAHRSDVEKFQPVLDRGLFRQMKHVFASSQTPMSRTIQNSIINKIVSVMYEMKRLEEQQRRLGTRAIANVTAANFRVDPIEWLGSTGDNKEYFGAFMLDGERLMPDAVEFIDMLYRYFTTTGENILSKIVIPTYTLLINELLPLQSNNIFEVYVRLVKTPSHSIASTGILKYIRELLKPISYIENVMKNISIPGYSLIKGINDNIYTLFSSVPRFPDKLYWVDGIDVVKPEQVGIYPLVVPALVQYDNRSSINGILYDTMPCQRGSIISVMSALDNDPKHHRLVKDATKRVIDAYSLILFINLKYRPGEMAFNPNADTGSTYAISIHCKELEIDSRTSKTTENFKAKTGKRFLVFDSKRFTTHEFNTNFDVEDFIFNMILPPLTHPTKPEKVVRTPIMVFKVMRLKDESKNAYYNPLRSIEPPVVDYNVFNFVSQDSNSAHANACTSYATIMAYFMFNGLGNDLLYGDGVDKQIALFKKLVDPFYEQACRKLNVRKGDMTYFVDLPQLPVGIDTYFGITQIAEVVGEVRRCVRSYDSNHPSLAKLGAFNSSADLALKRSFLDLIVNRFEVERGLIIQEISSIMYSPLTLVYDPVFKVYKSRQFAMGLTRLGHSILIYVGEFVYRVGDDSLPGGWPKRPSYFVYDSKPGTVIYFDSLVKLEEYIMTRITPGRLPVFGSMASLEAGKASNNFYDISVFFSEDDRTAMYKKHSEQLRAIGFHMEASSGKPKLEPTVSLGAVEVSHIGHYIDHSIAEVNVAKVMAIKSVNFNPKLVASTSGENTAPMSPLRVSVSSPPATSEGDNYDTIVLVTDTQIKATKEELERRKTERKLKDQQEMEKEREKKSLEKESEKQKREEEKKRKELESIIASSIEEEAKIEKVEQNLQREEEEIKQRQKQLQEAEKRKRDVEEKKQQQEAALSKSTEARRQLQALQEEKEKEKKRLDSDLKKIETETANMEKQVQLQNKNVEQAIERLKRIQAQINGKNAEIIKLQTKISELDAKKKTLVNEKEQSDLNEREVEAAMKDLLRRSEEFERLNADLEQEKQNYEKQVLDLVNVKEEQKRQQKAASERQKQLERETAQNERKARALERKNNKLKAKLNDTDVDMIDAPPIAEPLMNDDDDVLYLSSVDDEEGVGGEEEVDENTMDVFSLEDY